MHEFKVGQRYRFGSEEKGTVHEVDYSHHNNEITMEPGLGLDDPGPASYPHTWLSRLIEAGALTLIEPQVIELRLFRTSGPGTSYADRWSQLLYMPGLDAQELKVTIEVVR